MNIRIWLIAISVSWVCNHYCDISSKYELSRQTISLGALALFLHIYSNMIYQHSGLFEYIALF